MKKFKKELLFLVFFVVIFIGIRSINYVFHVNWSGDQASGGIDSLNIFRTRKLTLIGPQISANYQGHFIFFGPLTTYFYLFFLMLGTWDPVLSSYLFMIFASLMIFPLYFGVKKLVNSKAALLAVIIYSLVPYYINYTRFLWNPTFQIALLPFLILLMGFYQEKKTYISFFLLSIWVGILFQFHYQFVIVIIGLFIYYFLLKKISFPNLIFYIIGILIGFSPLVVFELKHNFYHLRTIILFIKNWQAVDRPGGITMPHYYIAISFMLIVAILGLFRKRIVKITNLYFVGIFLILMTYSLYLYVPVPQHAFWAPATPWNYLTEKKIYNIIQSTHLTENFNVANLGYYDTKASVIKYFMKRDGYQINYDDYYNNKLLFVICEDHKYPNALSYEVATFKPNKILNHWKINEKFDMFLLERVQSN